MSDEQVVGVVKKKNIFLRILSKFWAVLRTYFIGVGILWTALPILFIAAISSNTPKNINAEKKSKPVEVLSDIYLEVELRGSFTENEYDNSDLLMARLFGEEAPKNLHRFAEKLERIANTESIKGVLVKVENLSINSLQASVLESGFSKIKKNGKKIWFYAPEYDENSYLLASHADRIALAPAGAVSLLGNTFQVTFFGDAIKKIGAEVEVVRSGKYKSLAEPFVSNKPSKEFIDMYEGLVKDFSATYVDKVSARRTSGNKQMVGEWLQRSLYTAIQAKKDGLVDTIEHYNKFKDSIEKEFVKNTAESFKFTELKDAYLTEVSDYKEIDDLNKIVLLKYHGEIRMAGGDDPSVIYPEMVKKDIDWVLKQKDVKAAVMRVTSPGGSALASEIIWNELMRLKGKIPLVVSMGEVAASGGYYMSAAADKIIASENTVTGSIGVIGIIPNFANFESKYGISFHVFSESERNSLINPGKGLSEADKSLLLNSIEDTYDTFLTRVASGRKMGKNKVDEIAQGRVWTGNQAKQNGLVDEIGDLETAYFYAKEAAGLDTKKAYMVVRPEVGGSLFDCLKSGRLENCMQSGFDIKSKIKGITLSPVELKLTEELKNKSDMLLEFKKYPVQARM